jgi:hypothetical protein
MWCVALVLFFHTSILPTAAWTGFGVNAAFPLEPTILMVTELGTVLPPGIVGADALLPPQLHSATAPAAAIVDPISKRMTFSLPNRNGT